MSDSMERGELALEAAIPAKGLLYRPTVNFSGRVSPFRLKNCFAYKRNKANLDPFHMCFTISL
jgi:hypothetical protein